MKKLTLIILAMAATASGFAQSSVVDIATVRKIETDENVTSLKIYNNVEVVLTDDSTATIKVVGQETDVQNTSVKLAHGELTIGGSAEDLQEKVVVYVPAKFLDKVYIHGASRVTSEGMINNDQLDVMINGEGTTCIRSTGVISLNTIADFPLDPSSI